MPAIYDMGGLEEEGNSTAVLSFLPVVGKVVVAWWEGEEGREEPPCASI